MSNHKRGARTLASYIPVATALAGVTLVLASVVFFYAEDDLRRLISVSSGLAILTISVWFAANPFIRSSRRFKTLRRGVDEFLDLARLLNQQVVGEAEPEDVARTAAKMHEAVDLMVADAGETS